MRFRDPEAAALYFRNQPGTARERLALAEYGFSLRFSDPAAMRGWCDAALIGLPPQTDAQTTALLHGYAGNAHRVVGEFTSSEHLLRASLAHCTSPDPLLLEFWASLLTDLGRYTAASAALSQAAALRSQTKDPLARSSTLLQSAIVLDLTAQPVDAALVALGAIRALANHTASVKSEVLLRTALQNLAVYLTDAGDPKAALRVIRHSRPFLVRGGKSYELRVDWVLARISGALGDNSAREAFVAIRERFATEQMLQEVALVSLDLARHLLSTSPLEARAEVSFVGPILSQLGIAEDSEEVRLLRKILASAQPDLVPLTELSRLLHSRQIRES